MYVVRLGVFLSFFFFLIISDKSSKEDVSVIVFTPFHINDWVETITDTFLEAFLFALSSLAQIM